MDKKITLPKKSGIYRAASSDAELIKAECTTQAIACLDINLLYAMNIPSVVRAFKQALNTPASFRTSIDGLRESLCDLSWHPANGYVLTLSNTEVLSTNLTTFAALNELLSFVTKTWEANNTPFYVFYLTPDSNRDQTQTLH